MAVQDDPLLDVRGRGVESAPVRQPAEFTIDASNALFAANPLVIITGSHQSTTTTISVKLTRTTIVTFCQFVFIIVALLQYTVQHKTVPITFPLISR